jgi:hypothetical protein
VSGWSKPKVLELVLDQTIHFVKCINAFGKQPKRQASRSCCTLQGAQAIPPYLATLCHRPGNICAMLGTMHPLQDIDFAAIAYKCKWGFCGVDLGASQDKLVNGLAMVCGGICLGCFWLRLRLQKFSKLQLHPKEGSKQKWVSAHGIAIDDAGIWYVYVCRKRGVVTWPGVET